MPGWGISPMAVMPQYCPLPQAVVLEGNYWKRRIEVVMREYHKWRIYYKKRVSGPVPAAPCPSATMVGQDGGVPGAETWLPGSWPVVVPTVMVEGTWRGPVPGCPWCCGALWQSDLSWFCLACCMAWGWAWQCTCSARAGVGGAGLTASPRLGRDSLAAEAQPGSTCLQAGWPDVTLEVTPGQDNLAVARVAPALAARHAGRSMMPASSPAARSA